MSEYIKTAQAIASLPKEAGCGEWPWRVVNYRTSNGTSESCWRRKIDTLGQVEYMTKDLDSHKRYEVYGPWLNIDDFSPWSAAKWLDRAGVELTDETWYCAIDGFNTVIKSQCDRNVDNLECMKVILAIGQRAFGREILIARLENSASIDTYRIGLLVVLLRDNDINEARKCFDGMEVCMGGNTSAEGMEIIESTPYWDWTEEQRQPWLEAWQRGQDVK